MVRKLTYEFVKQSFESIGYKLLSKDYLNNHTKLYYKCDKGHVHSITWNDFKTGYRCKWCWEEKRSKNNYKGGVTKLNLPLFSTYASQLERYQPVYKIEHINLELLGVECTHCSKIFVPNKKAVQHRIAALNGKQKGEAHMYCSDECKQTCPIYRQILWPKTYQPYKVTRPNQSVWSNLIKERDNHTCQKCGISDGIMIAHHIDPVINNPIESLDLDNGLTLCKKCHKHVHNQTGCTTEELKC